MSFKSKINNYAKSTKLPAQVVLQNVMFERFLERLSKSEYKDKFVIKGGILISAILGLQTRTTMDIDTTLRKLSLTEPMIIEALTEICSMDVNDDIQFEIDSISPIRKDDLYGGYRVKIIAVFERIRTPLSIDISTGDIITPDPIKYEICNILDDNKKIFLWGYSIETILAEKIEAILSKGVTSTRPRDYYDVFMISTKETHDKNVFKKALKATSIHRGTWERIHDYEHILKQIENSDVMKEMWQKYQGSFDYAKKISFEKTIDSIRNILE